MKITLMRYTSLALGTLALILAAVLLMTGCGGSNTPATEPASPSPSSIIVIPEVSEPAVHENPSTPDLPVSEPASEPASEQSSVAPIPQVDSPWWQELFGCEDTFASVRNFYLHDNDRKLSYLGRNDFEYTRLAAAVTGSTEVAKLGKPIMEHLFIEMVMDSDDKYTVHFFEKGIELTHSHWKVKEKTIIKLAPATKDYDTIKQALTDMQNNGFSPKAMWLSTMNRGRIREISLTDPRGKNVTYNSKDNIAMLYLIEPIIREIGVNGTAQLVEKTAMLDNAFSIAFTFDNDVKYKVQVNTERMYISSTDVEQGLSYRLSGAIRTQGMLQDIVDKQINPNTPNEDYSFTPSDTKNVNPDTAKPVIYLYPERATDCTVTVDYDSFTYTYPTYNGGWRVTAYPDGRLINKSDGSEHYYLFWEGDKRVDWQFDSGFVVAGSDTEGFLRDKLAYMGLTPREYNDFITYWVPRMQDNAYNLITFAGEQYEQLAPLTVTPAPDSILRVHMVYKAIDTPVTIPEQVLTPFTRKGFTVVEWGGSVTN